MLFAVTGGFDFIGIAVAIVVIAAVAGIVLAYLKYAEIQIPPVIWHIFWIVVLAFVAIVAIHFVASMW